MERYELGVSLLLASERGNLRAIERILSMDEVKPVIGGVIPDIRNFQDLRGRTPLYLAIANKRYNIIEFLVKEGASIAVACGDSRAHVPLDRPFDMVMASDDIGVILAFARGVRAKFPDVLMEMLEAAVKMGRVQVIRAMLDQLPYREDVYGVDSIGRNALHYAALYGGSSTMNNLVKFASFEVVDGGEPVLSSQMGAIGKKDLNGDTPMHLAAATGNLDAMRVLIELGADVEAKNRTGDTPLHYSIKGGNVQAINFMLDHCNGSYDRNDLFALVGPGRNDLMECLQNKFQEIDNSNTTPQMGM